jgi:hypothetical protein
MKNWPIILGTFFVYYIKETKQNSIICLDRTIGTEQAADERVQELHRRGSSTAFYTSKPIKNTYI